MDSYFTVELDTTPPMISEFSVSAIVLSGQSLEIEASFNEDISEHILEITDAKGQTYSAILQAVTPRLLSGFVDTSDFSEGMAHVVLMVYDNVRNYSFSGADSAIVLEGLTYCMHDVIRYTPPTIKDVTVGKQAPKILSNEPEFRILYSAPTINTRRCHTI